MMTHLKEGDTAPNIIALNEHEQKITLEGFKGKKVILYFYPKDNTPGCTSESCNLNENYTLLKDKGFEVIGVSPDSSKSHTNFISKYHLRFNLIADIDKKVLKDYGCWGEKKMYGKTYEGVLRTTFIISEEGKIVKIFTKVKTKEHTKQILESLND